MRHDQIIEVLEVGEITVVTALEQCEEPASLTENEPVEEVVVVRG